MLLQRQSDTANNNHTRLYNHRSIYLGLFTFLSISLSFQTFSAPATKTPSAAETEVVHWWQRGGDAQALSIIINEFTARGGVWVNSPESNFDDTREQVVSRMAKGYPPTALQWNAGVESRQFAHLGLLNPVESSTQIKDLREHFHPEILKEVTVAGNLYGIPVNVHRENWLWTHNAHFSANNHLAPKSWQDILTISHDLQSKNITPIALGFESWQHRILFNDVLLGTLGPVGYSRFYRQKDVDLLSSENFIKAIRIFQNLKPYTRSFGEGDWNAQVNAVATGDAAMVFMGDWAKGEFITQDIKLGTEFDCLPAPGTDDSMLPVVDVFLLGKLDDASEKRGQRLLIDTLLDRNTLSAFNRIKGSVPPFRQLDNQRNDPCSDQVVSLLNQSDALVPSFASSGDGEFTSRIDDAIMALWSDEDADRASLIKPFREAFVSALNRDQTGRIQYATTDE